MIGQRFTVGDDFEAAARRAVAEEAGELRCMEAGSAATHGGPEVHAAEDPESAARLAVIQQQAEVIEGLQRESAARLALIERHAAALGDARAVLVLLVLSRPYQLMRLLGRWGWLEQRILRALR